MHENFKSIDPNQIQEKPFQLIGQEWMLITAGNGDNHTTFNTMTAAWGSLGTLWNKPVSFCFVRPSRHTYEFVEKNDIYTLSFFSKKYRDALNICGTVSGRDEDKVSKAGLTPVEVEPGAVTFKEARLVMVCRKWYYDDLEPAHFLNPGIEKNYPQKDYHRMYIGELIGAYENNPLKY